MCPTLVREHLTEVEDFLGFGVWGLMMLAGRKWELMPRLSDLLLYGAGPSEDSGLCPFGNVDCVGCALHVTKLSQQTFCETSKTMETVTGP